MHSVHEINFGQCYKNILNFQNLKFFNFELGIMNQNRKNYLT